MGQKEPAGKEKTGALDREQPGRRIQAKGTNLQDRHFTQIEQQGLTGLKKSLIRPVLHHGPPYTANRGVSSRIRVP